MTENHGVGGSIPPLGTIFRPARFAGAAGLFALFLAGPAPAHPLPPLEELESHFHDVVFRSEVGEGTGEEGQPLLKWRGPVRVMLRDEAAAAYAAVIEEHVADLARMTGLTFRFVHRARDANLHVHFRSVDEIREIFASPTANCGGILKGRGGNWTITGATVYIGTASDALIRHCIVEELTQVLGPTNDTRLTDDTIFNDASTRLTLSLRDRIVLRALYDARLRAGTRAGEAERLVRRVLEDVLARLRRSGQWD